MSTTTPRDHRGRPSRIRHQSCPGAPAAGFPSVHPFAPVGVQSFPPFRRGGLEQILLRREELVVGEEGCATHPLRRDIDKHSVKSVPAVKRRPAGERIARRRGRIATAIETARPAGRWLRPPASVAAVRTGVSAWRCRSLALSRSTLVGIEEAPDRHPSPGRSLPCPSEPRQACAGAALIHARESGERRARAGAPRSTTAASASWSDAMPPQAAKKSPVSRLQRRRAGRMVRRDQIELAVRQCLPRARRDSRASRIGGAHLNSVAPSGISSAAKREVVRTGLGGERQRLRRARREHGSDSAADEMHDVHARTESRAPSAISSSIACVFRLRRAARRARSRSVAGPPLRRGAGRGDRPAEAPRAPSAARPTGEDRHRRPKVALARLRELVHARGHEEALEGAHPASRERLELARVPRDDAADELDVDATLALAPPSRFACERARQWWSAGTS